MGWRSVVVAGRGARINPSLLSASATTMDTYTLRDLDSQQTRCYADCRYADRCVTSADENSASGFGRDDSWRPRDATVSIPDRRPVDVTYYFRYPDDESGYADDAAWTENAGSWCRMHGNAWKCGYRTLRAEDGCFGRWDDVTLDGGYGPQYLSTLHGAEREYMELLSAGRRQTAWSNAEVAALESGQTGSSCRIPTGTGNRFMETFKWMTVRRGSSKCIREGRSTLHHSIYI